MKSNIKKQLQFVIISLIFVFFRTLVIGPVVHAAQNYNPQSAILLAQDCNPNTQDCGSEGTDSSNDSGNNNDNSSAGANNNGLNTNGGGCSFDSDCESGYCDPSSSTCDVKPGNLPQQNGNHCDFDSSCESGYCDPSSSTCMANPNGGSGASGSCSNSNQCGSDSICNNGTCVENAELPVGSVCKPSDDQCQDGIATCSSSGRCVANTISASGAGNMMQCDNTGKCTNLQNGQIYQKNNNGSYSLNSPSTGSKSGNTSQNPANSNGTGSINPTCGGGLQNVNGVCVPLSPFTSSSIAGQTSWQNLVVIVLKYMLGFAGVVAVIFLIIGGFRYMTSNGNSEAAEKGRTALVNAIIGLVVIILAYTLINVITSLLTSGSVF